MKCNHKKGRLNPTLQKKYGIFVCNKCYKKAVGK